MVKGTVILNCVTSRPPIITSQLRILMFFHGSTTDYQFFEFKEMFQNHWSKLVFFNSFFMLITYMTIKFEFWHFFWKKKVEKLDLSSELDIRLERVKTHVAAIADLLFFQTNKQCHLREFTTWKGYWVFLFIVKNPTQALLLIEYISKGNKPRLTTFCVVLFYSLFLCHSLPCLVTLSLQLFSLSEGWQSQIILFHNRLGPKNADRLGIFCIRTFFVWYRGCLENDDR